MGFIDSSGKYHKEQATMQDAVPRPTSVWKASDHDRQRADHKFELVQPYLPNGEVNPEFLTAYPTESASEAYGFLPTDEEIAKRK
jgi:hypothetical protein